MTIGQRIKKARLHRGLTQKELGLLLGFSERSADVRIAQYESSARTPRADIKEKLSEILKMNPRYFSVPESFNADDIILLFLELDEKIHIDLKPVYGKSRTRINVHFGCELIDDFLIDWLRQRHALANNIITEKEYTDWVLAIPTLINKDNPGGTL